MRNREELLSGMAAAAAALGADFASGRGIAVFYAQLKGASWAGIALASLVFALMTGLLAHLARRSGAASTAMMLERSGCGRGIAALNTALIVAAGCMLADSAAHIGALVLPLKAARLWGVLGAALPAALLARFSPGLFRRAAALFGAVFMLFELGILLFGGSCGEMTAAVELKLENCGPAAAALGLVHGCAALCLCAGAVVRMGAGRMRPARMGLWSGCAFFAMLSLGNGALLRQGSAVLALEAPFAALASGWGKGGFYLSAAMVFFACALSLAALFQAFPGPGKRRGMPGK